MLNADILKELAKDCNAERIAEKKDSGCCAGCPLGPICPIVPDLASLSEAYEEKGDGRTFKMKETSLIAPCKNCEGRFSPANKCYKGDHYYKCPEYLKHVNKVRETK